ncbi:hypothetical protein DQE82_26885 [Micromonospora sp. LHW51205]|uniref:hypothetical protein n=1 Tax=Micromonospora sp. LHW51205 TaxID=2248752 RepID=UPI000DE8849F|nr:hypothetical protein [Micromonospora sp. LHW51205]RBQ05175.1 hypothetical protein DQE82_26885 [Micromonospora sp. LHW51205]
MTRRLPDLGRIDPNCAAPRHGDNSAYRQHCRCPHAREDHRLYNKRHRQGRPQPAYIDGTGTRRRLQALAVLGWRWEDLGQRLGTSWRGAQHLALDTGGVHHSSAARVAAVYRELCDRPGPSPIAAQRAVAKGWHGPLAWHDIDDPTCEPDTTDPDAPVIDEWAVTELLAGRLGADRLGEVDLIEAMRRLLADGLTPGQARYRLRLTNAHARRLIKAINTTTRTIPPTEETRAA